MSNEQIIRAWKNKKLAASLGEAVPANPAGSAAVAMKDIEANEASTSPQSLCSVYSCKCA
jgi:mersacidin/lichenicidin family type 2 lantibiotic